MAKCPDSWVNKAKVNIAEKNVLFTGYQKPHIRQLDKDASNCAVLDSVCSLTV